MEYVNFSEKYDAELIHTADWIADGKASFSIASLSAEVNEDFYFGSYSFRVLKQGETTVECLIDDAEGEFSKDVTTVTIDTLDRAIKKTDEFYSYEIYNGEVTILSVLSYQKNSFIGDIVIPSEFEGMPITAISEKAFDNMRSVTGFEIPASVKSIGAYAFADCVNLKWIKILGSETEVDETAIGYLYATKSFDDAIICFGADGAKSADMIRENGFLFYEESTLHGDIDSDGKITASDARIALRIACRIENYIEMAEQYADMDKNGSVTASDARTLLRISANIE